MKILVCEADFEKASNPSLRRIKVLGEIWGHCTTWLLSGAIFI